LGLFFVVVNSDERISSASVPAYFESKGAVVSPVPWSVSTRWLSSMATPVLDFVELEGSEEACGVHDLFEWLGAAAGGVDL
jgi:hypothetical protein